MGALYLFGVFVNWHLIEHSRTEPCLFLFKHIQLITVNTQLKCLDSNVSKVQGNNDNIHEIVIKSTGRLV